MNCPSCGRPLAAGARQCVYCAHGTDVRKKPQLAIPKGTVPERGGRGGGYAWGRLLLFLVLAGIVAAAIFHPGLNGKVRQLMASLGL